MCVYIYIYIYIHMLPSRTHRCRKGTSRGGLRPPGPGAWGSPADERPTSSNNINNINNDNNNNDNNINDNDKT